MTVSFHFACLMFAEPLLVIIEYVPFGDLLGYLRKSRGLNDTYYKDPDIKPQTNLTSQQLMKFAWQIADGMSYLSSKFVSCTKKRNKKTNSSQKRYTLLRRTVLVGLFFIQCHLFKLLFLRGANIFVTPAGELFHFWRYHLFLFFFLTWDRQSLCIIVGYLILDLNCFRFPSYHFRLSIFIYYFKDNLNKAFQVYFV